MRYYLVYNPAVQGLGLAAPIHRGDEVCAVTLFYARTGLAWGSSCFSLEHGTFKQGRGVFQTCSGERTALLGLEKGVVFS